MMISMEISYRISLNILHVFYFHGSMHCESMSIIVQQDVTIYRFIISLQTALHVSNDNLIHHQEHMQTVITISGTGTASSRLLHNSRQ